MLRVAPKQPPTGPVLALAGSVAILAAVGLAFYWLPSDVDQGFSQRIFYLHVPVAPTTYACFVFAGWKALRLLWTKDERADLASYTAVHIGHSSARPLALPAAGRSRELDERAVDAELGRARLHLLPQLEPPLQASLDCSVQHLTKTPVLPPREVAAR